MGVQIRRIWQSLLEAFGDLCFPTAGTLRSKTASVDNIRGSVDSLREDHHLTPTNGSGSGTHMEQQQQPTGRQTEEEEVLVVEIHREAPDKLGLSIVGGSDNPSLPTAHVRLHHCTEFNHFCTL